MLAVRQISSVEAAEIVREQGKVGSWTCSQSQEFPTMKIILLALALTAIGGRPMQFASSADLAQSLMTESGSTVRRAYAFLLDAQRQPPRSRMDRDATLPEMPGDLGHGNIATTSGYLHARPESSSGLKLDPSVFLR